MALTTAAQPAATILMALSLAAAGALAAPAVSSAAGADATPAPATPAPGTDPYDAYLSLMREVARAEGRVSDLRKERDEALTRLESQRTPPAADGAPSASPPSPRDAQIDARIAQESEHFAREIAAAEAHLQALAQRAADLKATLP